MVEGHGNNWRESYTAAVSFAVSAQTISLPKGGGAIGGTGDIFLGARAGYRIAALSTVEFTYSTAGIDETARDAAVDALREGVTALTSNGWSWTGKHLTGALGEAATGWFYLDTGSKASGGWLDPVRLVRGLDPRPASLGWR